jgi:hypothetical protein
MRNFFDLVVWSEQQRLCRNGDSGLAMVCNMLSLELRTEISIYKELYNKLEDDQRSLSSRHGARAWGSWQPVRLFTHVGGNSFLCKGDGVWVITGQA